MVTEGERCRADGESAPSFTKSPKMSATSLSPVRPNMFSSSLVINKRQVIGRREMEKIEKSLVLFVNVAIFICLVQIARTFHFSKTIF